MPVSEPAAVELLTSVSRLVRTARTYAHQRNQHLGRAGLPLGILTRLNVAMTRPTDLALALGVSPSAVSRAVTGLVEAGFVERTADPSDARACTLTLTGAGSTELQHLHHEQARTISTALDGWDDAKAVLLAELLDELGTALLAPALDTRAPTYAGRSPAPATTDTHHHPLTTDKTTDKALA